MGYTLQLTGKANRMGKFGAVIKPTNSADLAAPESWEETWAQARPAEIAILVDNDALKVISACISGALQFVPEREFHTRTGFSLASARHASEAIDRILEGLPRTEP